MDIKQPVKRESSGNLVTQYAELMKLIPAQRTRLNENSDLSQPSTFEEVETITTYGVSFVSKEKNA